VERARQGQREAENKLSSLEVVLLIFPCEKLLEIMFFCLNQGLIRIIYLMFGFNISG
jgi:hypothetical protein